MAQPSSNPSCVPFCLGCSTQFDLDEHAPRFLSECAHSLCISCVLGREPPHCCAFCEEEFDVDEARFNVDEIMTALVEGTAAAAVASKERRCTRDDCDGAEAVECRSELVSIFGLVYFSTLGVKEKWQEGSTRKP